MDATPPRYSPFADPVRTDVEILGRIGQLIPASARGRRSLVLFFLDGDARTLPVVVPIDDVPEDPEPAVIENLCWILSQVLSEQDPDASVVIMLTRPGRAEPDSTDLTWRDRMSGAAVSQGVRVRLVCLATPGGLLALTGGAGRKPVSE
jgi:hypothetical protein